MTEHDWRRSLHADPSDWLLQEENPSVRYLTLTEILDASAGSPEVERARRAIAEWDLVRHVLASQTPQGYWGDNIDKPYGSQRTTLSCWHGAARRSRGTRAFGTAAHGALAPHRF
jgi:hypothetical protein